MTDDPTLPQCGRETEAGTPIAPPLTLGSWTGIGEDFPRIAEYVLTKNAELYRRLAGGPPAERGLSRLGSQSLGLATLGLVLDAPVVSDNTRTWTPPSDEILFYRAVDWWPARSANDLADELAAAGAG